MSSLLLDTHALLWYGQAEPYVSSGFLDLLGRASGPCFISRASLWEVTIKHSLGKLRLPDSLAKWLVDVRQQFPVVEISDTHLLQLDQLLKIPTHRDPFDRLLIAQALTEKLTLVSRDGKFAAYAEAGLQTCWA